MGECGCGSMEAIRGIYAIGDAVLVVETYTGCQSCHTGLATTLHLFSAEEAEEEMLEPTETFEPDQWGSAQKMFPVIDQSDLVEALDELPDLEHYGNLKNWLEDNGRELLKRAAYICMKNDEG